MKRGGRLNNQNALRHGLACSRVPERCEWLRRQLAGFRRSLEAATVEAYGEINLVRAAMIDTALQWQRHGVLCMRWLRLEGDKLTPAERLAFSQGAAVAAERRDKAIKALELDKRRSALDEFYGGPILADGADTQSGLEGGENGQST